MTMLSPPPEAARPFDRRAGFFDDAATGLDKIGNYRAVLHSSPAMLVEDCAALPHSPPISGYDDRYQLVLPNHGLFGDLALDLGCSCHSHFSYVFRKCLGLTPSKYRDAASCALPSTRLHRAEDSPR